MRANFAVLGFVPQMLMLFIFLAFLESCGCMTRIAYGMNLILNDVVKNMATAYGLYYKIQQFLLFAAFGMSIDCGRGSDYFRKNIFKRKIKNYKRFLSGNYFY